MVELFLAAAPTLLILSLAGYGAAVGAVFVRKDSADGSWDLFECAFVGIFVIAASVLIVNFFVGLGTNPGPYVLATGIMLFAIFQLYNRFQWNQLILVIFVASIICCRPALWDDQPDPGYIGLGYDTGLYYMSSMNWLAYQPAPFGLANFEGRLGFDSAWLLLEAAIRAERHLGWSHLRVAEITIRALVLGWISRRFLMEIANGWHARSIFFLSALIALWTFIFESGATATTMSGNLLAFCAWVLFCKLMLLDEGERRIIGGRDLSLLLILIVLAVTVKISILPVALLLPMLLLRMSGYEISALFLSQRGLLSITLVYGILWLARNFILTGCIVYPIAMTCASVPWGVGAVEAKREAAWITGWARHPGPEFFLNFPGIFNTEWIPSWFMNFRHSSELKLVVAAVAFVLLSCILVERRDRTHPLQDTRSLVWASIVCAAVGLVLWFLGAPDVRFSWVFFSILSATLIFHGLWEFDFVPPKIGFMRLTMRKFVIGSFVLAAIAAIIQLRWGYLVPVAAPTPPSKIVTVSGNWQIYMPTSGDQCWGLFPCTPYDFGVKSVESWHNHLFFRSNIK